MAQRPFATLLSYSHLNQEQRRKLRDHFAPLERAGLIRIWDDRELLVGQEVDASIGAKLEETEVFILLVSEGFLASAYCSSIEMKRALERHAEGTALVLPIIIEPCRWKSSPLAELVVAPTDGKPISEWPSVDAGWANATNLMWASLLGHRQRRRARKWLPATSAVAAALLAAAGVAFQLKPSPAPQAPLPPPAVPATPAETVIPIATAKEDAETGGDAGTRNRPARTTPLPIELMVISEPQGTITVHAGGKTPSGPSPLIVHLNPGPIEIEASGSGEHSFRKRESFEVKTAPRQQRYTVKASKGTVQFNSRPASHVIVDGVVRFDVPDQRELYEGEHTAVFECDRRTLDCADKPDAPRSFVVKPGENSPVIHLWE